MGSMSLSHWLIVLAIVLLVFGAGKIPQLMGDMAKGIKSFKKGLADEPGAEAAEEAKSIEQKAAETAKTEPEKAKS